MFQKHEFGGSNPLRSMPFGVNDKPLLVRFYPIKFRQKIIDKNSIYEKVRLLNVCGVIITKMHLLIKTILRFYLWCNSSIAA